MEITGAPSAEAVAELAMEHKVLLTSIQEDKADLEDAFFALTSQATEFNAVGGENR